MDSRDKRAVRCDATLCRLFNLDNNTSTTSSVILLNTIRARLLDAQLIKPINKVQSSVVEGYKFNVDYNLTSAYNTVVDVTNDYW